jgi:IclR family transcriptional regulator, KDG regulon repressor
MSIDPSKPYYMISTVAKAFRLLEFLAESDPLTLTEIAARQGIQKSAAHRFLATLRDLGYIITDQHNRYLVSFRLFEMGMRVANSTGILEVAQPYMKKIAQMHNETVNLARLEGTKIIFIKKIGSTAILRTDLAVGSRVPAYCTALGKAVMAFLPDDQLIPLIEAMEMRERTPFTLVKPKALLEALAKVRGKGYAADDQEYVKGLCCVAAPIFNHTTTVQYALSVSGPAFRLDKDTLTKVRQDLLQVSGELSRALGYTGDYPFKSKNFTNPQGENYE